ncbi:MAG: hypothetical protein ABI912_02330 [Actinomycetota bacterium]
MAEGQQSDQPTPVERALRRAAEANIAYYRAWGELGTAWLREMANLRRDLLGSSAGSVVDSIASRVVTMRPVPLHSVPSVFAATEPTPGASTAPAPGSGTAPLVLEAVAGATATAAFVVENTLAHEVDAVVESDGFHGPDGSVAEDLAPVFDPLRVRLAAGEGQVVRVSVVIPDSIDENTEHHTTVRVVGVPGTTIALRLRRVPA